MEPEQLFIQRFSELANNGNYTLEEIGKQIGIKSKSTISKYLSGNIKNVKRNHIVKLAELFNVSAAWLAGLSEDKYGPSKMDNFGNSVLSIPLLSQITSFADFLAQKDKIGMVDIKADLAKTGSFFALKMTDTSMYETLWDGDIVAVKVQDFAEDGNLVVVLINDSKSMVRKIKFLDNGFKLIPLNRQINSKTGEPFYEDLYFTKEEICSKPVKIIGVVKQLLQRDF